MRKLKTIAKLVSYLEPSKRQKQREAKRIERMLNSFRDQINKEAGVEVIPYKAKVEFKEAKGQ